MKQTWELMGNTKLQWSPIQLSMENQQNMFHLGRLPGVTKDNEGVRTTTDFEVIEIIVDSNLYPALLGIDQAFDNMAIINLKKRQMIFEGNNMGVLSPLDPSKGLRYIELVKEEYCAADIDNIYQMTVKEQECVNPTAEGKLSWEQDISCTSDLDSELENWHNRLHEVSIRHCARITKSIHCMISEVCNLPSYDGLGDVNTFLNDYEEQVP